MKKRWVKILLPVLAVVVFIVSLTVGLVYSNIGAYNFMNAYGIPDYIADYSSEEGYNATRAFKYTTIDELSQGGYSLEHCSGAVVKVIDNAGKVGLYNVVEEEWIQSPKAYAKVTSELNILAELELEAVIYSEYAGGGPECTAEYVYLNDGTLLGTDMTSGEYTTSVDLLDKKVVIKRIDGFVPGEKVAEYTITFKKDYGYKVKTKNIKPKKFDEIYPQNSMMTEMYALALGMKGYDVAGLEGMGNGTIVTSKNGKVKSTFNAVNKIILGLSDGKILYAEQNNLPADAKKYDYQRNGNKYSYQLYSFNIKNGKASEVKTKYVFSDNGIDGLEFPGNDSIVSARKINKDKTLGEEVILAVNGKGVVKDVTDTLIAGITDIEPISDDRFYATINIGESSKHAILDRYLNIVVDLDQFSMDDYDANGRVMIVSNDDGDRVQRAIDYKGNIIDINGQLIISGGHIIGETEKIDESDSSKNYMEITTYNVKTKKRVSYKAVETVQGLILNTSGQLIDITTGKVLLSNLTDTISYTTLYSDIVVGNGVIDIYFTPYQDKTACLVSRS